MSSPDAPPTAWEPLTPGGVARFARASFGRLWLVQFIVAMLLAAAVLWFFYDAWCPTIRKAIEQLPAEGEIRSAKLDWKEGAPRLLADGHFLAFSVDLEHTGQIRSPAHVQVEFGRESVQLISLLGYVQFRYPPDWIIPFNRNDLQPWWGAWKPGILAVAALALALGLPLFWGILATLYALPVWLVAYYTNRDLNLAGSWRLAGAALLPGSIVWGAALLAYDMGALDLLDLLFFVIGQFVLGWLYLWVSPLFLPRSAAVGRKPRNPFSAG